MTTAINLQRPPLVKGLPFLGSAFPLMKNPHEFVQDAYFEYGSAFRFNAAHRSYVVIGGVAANRFVSGEGKELFGVDGFWGKAGEFMGCPHMMVAVDGEMHQFQRSIMMPLLNQKAFRDRIDKLAEPVEQLIHKNQGKSSLEVGGFLRQLVSNQIGFNLQGHKSSYKTVQLMIYYFGSVMNVYGLRKWPTAMLHTPKFKYAEYVTHKHVRKTLVLAENRTEQQKQDSPNYLDSIIPAMKTKPEWFGEGDIAVHALLPFVAALDTVASTMGFMLHRLLTTQEIKALVQEEVDQYFCDGLPTLKELRDMQALNGLIKETLRLQPTGFGITRTATSDFEFEGFRIFKGEDVLVFTTADHLNRDYFTNPNEFDIHRFSAPRNEHKQPAYAPFGKGPHNCLGASLAEIMLPLNIGLLLSQLDIKPACNLKKVKTIFNPAPVLDDSFRVKLIKR